MAIMWSGSFFLAHATWHRDVSTSVNLFCGQSCNGFSQLLPKKVCYHTFVSESVPLPPPPPHLQAGWLCQHAEWGGVPRPSWTRCPAALHSGVGGPVEKCPSAAGRERSAARETVWSPACVWSRLTLSACVPSVTISVHASTSSSRCVCVDTSCPDAASSLDLAVKPGSEGGRRRTRRYLPGGPGAGRKTSERFRTQPITANEMEESSG